MTVLRSARQGPVLVVRFLSPPSASTDQRVRALMREAFVETGEAVTFIGLLPEPAKVAGAVFDERLAARSRELDAPTAAMHFVIEGEDTASKLRRSALKSLARASARFPVRVHARAEHALIMAGAERSIDLSALFAAAKVAGVLPERR